jgi:hypothetical protein
MGSPLPTGGASTAAGDWITVPSPGSGAASSADPCFARPGESELMDEDGFILSRNRRSDISHPEMNSWQNHDCLSYQSAIFIEHLKIPKIRNDSETFSFL